MAAAVVVAAGMAATTTTGIAAERVRTTAMAAASAMMMAVATAVAAAIVDSRCQGCVEMPVVVFRGRGGRAAMLINGGGGDGVFIVAMTFSGRPCPRLRRRAMATAAMGKASEGARVRARMGHC